MTHINALNYRKTYRPRDAALAKLACINARAAHSLNGCRRIHAPYDCESTSGRGFIAPPYMRLCASLPQSNAKCLFFFALPCEKKTSKDDAVCSVTGSAKSKSKTIVFVACVVLLLQRFANSSGGIDPPTRDGDCVGGVAVFASC